MPRMDASDPDMAALRAENARLQARVAELEQTAAERRRVARVNRALAEASRSFAETGQSVGATLDAIARQLAEALGDACVIWLLSADGATRSIAALHHPDPAALALLRELAAVEDAVPAHDWVMLQGHADLYPVVPPEDIPKRFWRGFWPYAERYPTHSVIAVSLQAPERGVIGAVRLSRDVTPEPYDVADLELVERLAERAALAIENARLYAAE
jgi:GAF domain-containing protein